MKRTVTGWIKGPYKNKKRDYSGLTLLAALLVLAAAIFVLICSAL